MSRRINFEFSAFADIRDSENHAVSSERVLQGADEIVKEGLAINAMTKAEFSGSLMEAVCERQNLKAAYPSSDEEQRQRRCRWHVC